MWLAMTQRKVSHHNWSQEEIRVLRGHQAWGGQYAWYCVSTMSSHQIDQAKNKKRTYVHDICLRCGHVVKRSQDGS